MVAQEAGQFTAGAEIYPEKGAGPVTLPPAPQDLLTIPSSQPVESWPDAQECLFSNSPASPEIPPNQEVPQAPVEIEDSLVPLNAQGPDPPADTQALSLTLPETQKIPTHLSDSNQLSQTQAPQSSQAPEAPSATGATGEGEDRRGRSPTYWRIRRYCAPKASGALKCSPEVMQLWNSDKGRSSVISTKM